MICALANDMPDHRRSGVIFIGQNDDLSCANLAVTDDLLLKNQWVVFRWQYNSAACRYRKGGGN